MSIPDLKRKMTEEEVSEFLKKDLLPLRHETEWVEFKTVSSKFNFDKLGRYVSALSNEAYLHGQDWGWLVFGVDDDHQIVGTGYKREDPKGLNQLKNNVGQHVSYGAAFHEIYDVLVEAVGDAGSAKQLRVVLFQILTASRARPKAWKNRLYGREGDSIGMLSVDKYDRFLFDNPDDIVTPVSYGDKLKQANDVNSSTRELREVAPPSQQHEMNTWLPRSNRVTMLPALIRQHQRITLYGSAGTGKTMELRQMARECDAIIDNQTCFVSLESYANEPLERLLPPEMRTKEDSSLLLFFDGYEQIQKEHRLDFLRRLESFAVAYHQAKIVVSARTNFLDVCTRTSCSTLRNFLPFEMIPLDHDRIMSLLGGALGKDKDRFLECLPGQVGDLLVNPFYLRYLVDRFKQNGKLPQNQATVFQDLFNERWRSDLEHFRTTLLDLADSRKEVEGLLGRLAVAMESLCRNWLSHDEYLSLIPERENRFLLQHCGVWEKWIGKHTVRWQFQHKGFQEHFAARRLEQLSLETIRQFVAFPPDQKAIRPQWSNVVGFLLDFTSREDVFDWVLSVDPTLAIKTDPQRIEPGKRKQIFRKVYNNAKAKKIWIDRDKYPMRELARFANHRDNVDFLLTEAENHKSKEQLGNIIYLLRFMRIPYSQEERTQNLFKTVALDKNEDETIRSLAIFALSEQGFNRASLLEEVVEKLKDSENDWIRYSLYAFLHNSAQLDKYVDVFVKGIPHIRTQTGRTQMQHRLLNEGIELSNGINKMQSPAAIKKILEHFTANPSDLNEIRLKVREGGFVANAAHAYARDQSVYDKVIQCFLALSAKYYEKEAASFVAFFEKTETGSRAFEDVLNKRNAEPNWDGALAMLANEDRLATLINKHKQREVQKKVLFDVWNILWINSATLAEWFQERLSNEFEDNSDVPVLRNHQQEQETQVKRFTDLFFDKEEFLQQISHILQDIDDDNVACADVSAIRRQKKTDYPRFVLDELRDITAREAIPKKTIEERFRNLDFEWFRAAKLHELMSSGQPVELTDWQTEEMRKWCLNNLERVDFRTAIEVDGERTTYKWLAIFLWFFFRELNLEYPKEVLLDMLSFDYFEPEKYSGIEYLETHLTYRDMRKRVLDNIKEGIESGHILNNHLDYCIRHEEHDAIPFARKIACDNKRGEDVRRTALKLIVSLAPEKLCSLFEQAADPFKWNIVNEMIQKGDGKCRKGLLELARESTGDEEDYALSCLVRLADLAGLKLYVEKTQRHQKVVKKPWPLGENPLAFFEDIAALPLLLDLLESSYAVDDDNNIPLNSLHAAVQDALTTLALVSDQNHAEVQKGVKQFIEEHPHLDHVHYQYAFLERLEAQFYREKTEKLDIHDVIEKLEKYRV